MKSTVVLPILFLAVFSDLCQGSRILGLFPFQGRSHFIMFEQLMKGLARKGHQVDVVSFFPLKEPYPNYNDIIAFPIEINLVNNVTFDTVTTHFSGDPTQWIAEQAGNVMCENLGHPELLKIARNPPKDPPYDLVITELFGANCFIVFGHLLKVPVIGVSTSTPHAWMDDMVANPDNFAFVSNIVLNYVKPMNFWERLHNTVIGVRSKLLFHYYTSPQDDLIKRNFGKDAPGLRELERSIALILTNTHHSVNFICPKTHAVIEVGGLHIQDEGPELPTHLKKWLDESTNGFVYFTLGSMVRIETFPKKVLDVFYESLKKLAPVRVLMKIAKPEELPPGLPENILIQKWMPQMKILSHKNIRAFITHGGLMGTLETIHFGVPMIGIPLFADQYANIKSNVEKNIAIFLDYRNISVTSMDAALNSVIKNPIYRNAAKMLSAKFLDRPSPALDTAIYWVEYIIRHGSNAVRSPAMDLTWWQIALLDVYGAILLAAMVTVWLTFILVRIAIRTISSRMVDSVSRSKKNN